MLKKLLLCFTINLVLITCVRAESLSSSIGHLLAPYRQAFFGVEVKDLTTGNVIYSRNPQRLFLPASNMKLFTASAAIEYLGANFQFDTQLLASTLHVEKHRLKGNVVIRFVGDPSFTRQDLRHLITYLKRQGIDKIEGNVYLQANAFDDIHYGPGWMWDDENSCFSAPLSSVIVDHNCFTAIVKPSRKIGAKPHITLEHAYRFIKFVNQAKTIAQKNRLCPLDLTADKQNVYHLTGCIARTQRKLYLDMAIKNPILSAEYLVKRYLRLEHIELTGKVVVGQPKGALYEVARHRSAKLPALLTTMLKESDNLYADSLFKVMGGRYFKQAGSWENGAKAVQTILASRTGINFKHLALYDGAGASRYDLLSPNAIITLLTFIHEQPDLKRYLLPALPISGRDGTLAGRMRGRYLIGRVHAKTGTMTGVSNLSGFIQTPTNHLLAFSLMINNFVLKVRTMRHLEDRFCLLLVKVFNA